MKAAGDNSSVAFRVTFRSHSKIFSSTLQYVALYRYVAMGQNKQVRLEQFARDIKSLLGSGFPH